MIMVGNPNHDDKGLFSSGPGGGGTKSPAALARKAARIAAMPTFSNMPKHGSPEMDRFKQAHDQGNKYFSKTGKFQHAQWLADNDAKMKAAGTGPYSPEHQAWLASMKNK
jgi:hypothetical protein